MEGTSGGDDFGPVVDLIQNLGKMALDAQGTSRVEIKKDGTYVTDADREVEKRLRGFLHERFPDHRVLGEEGGFTGPQESRWTWVLDPIDGTTNYANGLPVWAISVGLLDGNSPHWGCVFVPPLDQLFTGRKGHGAFRNGERIAPLQRTQLEREDIIAITSDGAKRWDYHFPQKIRALGSAAAQAVYVACGHYVGYFLDEWYVWDIAAALVLALEAKVEVTYQDGADFASLPRLDSQKGPPILFSVPGLNAALRPLIVPKAI